jgi:AP-3 complex subunit beta
MCYSLDSSHQPELVSVITTLLRDKSPLSIGSAAVAFGAVCPTRLDLLHPHYRRMCRLLVDLDEWGQLMWLNLLLRYARAMLPRPPPNCAEDAHHGDIDLELLLSSSESLLHSRNPAVGRP